MKVLLILSVFLSLQLKAQTSNPRETFRTYLTSMVKIKGGDHSAKNYDQALATLDLSEYSEAQRKEIGKTLSLKLIQVLDKIQKVDYEKIPESPKQNTWYFDKRLYQNTLLEISITKIDDQWLFSQDTLKSLDNYSILLRNKQYAKDIVQLSTVAEKVRTVVPVSMLQSDFLIENWQWPALFFILLLCFISEKLSFFFIDRILIKFLKAIDEDYKKHLHNISTPLSKLISFSVLYKAIELIDLPIYLSDKIQRVVSIVLSIVIVWAVHRFINLASYYFTLKASETDNKFDDIFIPLMTKTSFIFAYAIGAILILKSLTFDVTSILAGLGIGGLAFAFAAKDTLANFFGSIMLVLDRPFDIGDVITAGDIEGTVAEVGFRSTRIRTFYDSIITVSNGQLMNLAIDNKGKRRYRRLSTSLGIEYDTPPEKVEAFCEGIRQIIADHKWTRKDYFNVYFTNFGASALEIQLMVFWETDDYTREQAEKHRLMIDVLRLAKEMEIEFAFPTQTIHLYNEQKAQKKNLDDKYFDAGILKAKEVVQKPFSLKNPRSNVYDKGQFGENDIGL